MGRAERPSSVISFSPCQEDSSALTRLAVFARPLAQDYYHRLLESIDMSNEKYDIIIVGSTSGAVAAAIQSSKLGRRVAMISPVKHIGEWTWFRMQNASDQT